MLLRPKLLFHLVNALKGFIGKILDISFLKSKIRKCCQQPGKICLHQKCSLNQTETDISTNPLYKNINGNKNWKVINSTEVETSNHWKWRLVKYILLTGETLNKQISVSPVDYLVCK